MTSAYQLPNGNIQISFSGGRTSAYMLHQILQANGDLPERCQIMFANTGREMPQTLNFVNECSMRWNVPVVWLEYDRVDNRATYRIASWDDHAMFGEPFELLLRRKKYLPNTVMRFCTTELKILTMKRYLTKQLGWKQWTAAVGIRADEAHRAKTDSKDRWSYWYPLHEAGVTKRDIYQFWKSQPFDLQLENVNGATPLGNCDMCFLKSEKILANIAKTMPDKADWWIRMEQETGSTFRKDRNLAEFTDFVGRQSDWVFDDESFFLPSRWRGVYWMSDPQDLAISASKILTSRAKKLGPYQPLYKELAIRWTLVLGVEVTPAQTARMLVEMKLARWNAGFDEDHAIDAANYSFIAAALEGESE